MSKQSAGERIVEDWACGRLTGTVAEAIDEALSKAKEFAAAKVGNNVYLKYSGTLTVYDTEGRCIYTTIIAPNLSWLIEQLTIANKEKS